ncbi:MAG: hypothetical protein N2315_00925 [Thermanaerothrix sp.]|nr:hypothetical protein [Thermanaerothrix sp.]
MRCNGCGVCSIVCPKGAVELLPSEQGLIFESETDLAPMFHARLKPGVENSGRLVQAIRDRARISGRELGKDWILILIDGPPGIACPAISALTGASMGLIVAKPSMSGVHDLRRILETARQLRVPCAAVINRWDLSKEGSMDIRRVCQEAGCPILGEIPFMPQVVKDLAMGRIPAIQEDVMERMLLGIHHMANGL